MRQTDRQTHTDRQRRTDSDRRTDQPAECLSPVSSSFLSPPHQPCGGSSQTLSNAKSVSSQTRPRIYQTRPNARQRDTLRISLGRPKMGEPQHACICARVAHIFLHLLLSAQLLFTEKGYLKGALTISFDYCRGVSICGCIYL